MKNREQKARAAAADACERLLGIAEESEAGEDGGVAVFLVSLFVARNKTSLVLDLLGLQIVDPKISHDMLACLDAIRWGVADILALARDGHSRVIAVEKSWGVLSG